MNGLHKPHRTLTQFPGERHRWSNRQARKNHKTGLITEADVSGFSALAKARSAKRESHQVVGNALGILTLVLHIFMSGDVIGTSADCAPLALSPQFHVLRTFIPHADYLGDNAHVPVCHLTTVAPVVRAFDSSPGLTIRLSPIASQPFCRNK